MVLKFHRRIQNPLSRGIFFALIIVLSILFSLSMLCSCSKKKQSSTNPSDASSEEKSGEFILLGFRPSIMETSIQMMKKCTDFKSGESPTFNLAHIGEKQIPVEIDIENAYASIYPDNRKVVFYPVKSIRIPLENEVIPCGYLHYFDDNQLNIFFEIIISLPREKVFETPSTGDAPPPSRYQARFVSNAGDFYGLARTRILEKTELQDEEAFRKFDSSKRTVLLGTNSLDENKFLFIFLKIPGWDKQVFQIYQRWY